MINLVPDQTLPIMWVIFMVVLFVLNNLVFKPTLEIIAGRKAKTLGLREKAEKLSHEVASRLASYEASFNKARQNAAIERENILQAARLEERSIIDPARSETEKTLSEIRRTIAGEKDSAAVLLKKEADAIASDMISKVLER